MSVEVIGVGFGRTGTLSLKFALEQLGFSACYHMRDLLARPGHAETWTRIVQGEAPDWPGLFNGYRALVDWPCAHYWRELIAYYPQARVVLTVRDPDDWYDSIAATIFTAIGMAFPNGATEPQLPADAPALTVSQIILAKTLIAKNVFQDRLQDKQHCVSVYQQHNEEVRRTVPAERLLVYEVSQGWTPLCAFLHVPAPDGAFPNSNTKEEFHSHLGKPGD